MTEFIGKPLKSGKLKFSSTRLPYVFLCLTAFFIPIATAPVNLMSLLVLLSVVIVPAARSRFISVLKDPLVILVMLLYLLIVLSVFNPSNDSHFNSTYLAKYFRLLLIPFFAACIASNDDAKNVLKAFVLGVVITVLFSYLVYFGFIQGEDNTYFKGYITHGFFGCLAFFWFFLQLKDNFRNLTALDWALAFIATCLLINLFLIVDGRTGWLAFILAFGLYTARKVSFKGLFILSVFSVAIFAALYFLSDSFHERIALGLHEVIAWSESKQGSSQTSMGLRMSFWLYSLKAFSQHPWLGYGIGGFQDAVGSFSSIDGFAPFKNPHNQFFLFLVQLGLLGFALYMAILYQSIKRSLKNDWFYLFLIAFITASLFNSFNYDFAESYAFALFLGCFGVKRSNVD